MEQCLIKVLDGRRRCNSEHASLFHTPTLRCLNENDSIVDGCGYILLNKIYLGNENLQVMTRRDLQLEVS